MSDIINSLGGPTPDLPSLDIHRKLKEHHAFSEEERKLVAGIYRRLGELTDALRAVSAKPAATPEPTQATLDLEPGTIAREIAAKPRVWGNVVKVYCAMWACFDTARFTFFDLVNRSTAILAPTGGKVGVASMSRILSVLVRAGVCVKAGRSTYELHEPTEERKDTVERVARKRKEVAA